MTQTGQYKQTRITAKQTSFIVNLCQRKGRQCPSSVLRWSARFASQYISFLLSLPDITEPRRYLSETDMLFNSQRRAWRNGEYYSDGLDDIPVTKSLNARREQEEESW